MLKFIEVFAPLGGFSLCLLLLSVYFIVSSKPLIKPRDIKVSVYFMIAYSVVMLSGRLGFIPMELGSYDSSYTLVAVLFLQSAVLLWYRLYVFSLAAICSYVLYLFNAYDSAIFSLYLVDGFTLFFCGAVIYLCKFKERSKKESEHV